MENIMDVTSAFREDAVERLSSQIQETRTAVRRGLDQAIPASIAGLSAYASDEGHAEGLLRAFRAGNYPHVEPEEVTRVVTDARATTALSRSGEGFLRGVFGERLSNIVDAIAGQAGVSRASASTLLGLATPLVLQAVGREATARNLDARGLSEFLSEQRRTAETTLPAPLTAALGGMSYGQANPERRIGSTDASRDLPRADDVRRAPLDVGAPRSGTEREGATVPGARAEGASAGLIWLLAALALLALFSFFVLRQRRAEEPIERPDITIPQPGRDLPPP